ncbi:hypothetical protein MPTK1_2g14820 [Marchantia polymorpha subsp. ruderalis]|uniref:Uncharacterized protein n=1 Tax=Marchantia polymorpha TaxID=3197 RepID=A0A2R6X1U4_MARPO|nr:hypothetical protein MARPO_0042s0104 [Marchantia polymorpha]BBN02375.1 hypothetical protein Mp_2g14820 [Marchantia polymorpha subsp. ruderalis]|eukprot:PTQ40070.1 hypothetical protein MARPO_0042s0104 [Marchantia polymorpha]
MGRNQSWTKVVTWSTLHEYPYSMLALTAYLYYIMIFFNPLKFVMNMLLHRLPSLILDVSPLVMVMLFFIATGSNNPSASASSLNSRCTVISPTINSSKRENSIHRESSLTRSSYPRSWPSWDWLQPYDPDLFLRPEKKMGSKAGDTDWKNPSGRSAEPRVQESSSAMDRSNSVVACTCEGCTYSRRSEGQAPLDEPAQQPTPRSDPIFRVQRSSGEKKLSKESRDYEKVIDPVQQALEGRTSLAIKKSHGATSAIAGGDEKVTATEFEIQVTAAEMGEHQSTRSKSAGPVHADPCERLANTIRAGGYFNALPDPQPVSQASPEVSAADPGQYKNGKINEVEDPPDVITSHSQLFSVGSLNDWSQLHCGQDEISDDNVGDQRGEESEIVFPITLEAINRPSPHTEVNQDRVSVPSTSKNFIGLKAVPCTAAAEPLPVIKDPGFFSELGSLPLEKVSQLYSFKHMTLDEKNEEKAYWVEKWRRCGEVESRHKAPPDKNLFQGLTLSASFRHASVDNDTYKPSAPPFDPLLFYDNFIKDRGFANPSVFFKTYKPFVTDEGNVFLFNFQEPESSLLHLCGRY